MASSTPSIRPIRVIRSSAEWSTWLGRTESGIAVTMPSTSVTWLLTSSMLRNLPLATQARGDGGRRGASGSPGIQGHGQM